MIEVNKNLKADPDVERYTNRKGREALREENVAFLQPF